MLKLIIKVLIMSAIAFILNGCSDSSSESITVYLLQLDLPEPDYFGRPHKNETFIALPERTVVWKNANAVYIKNPSESGTINRDCIVENKNNWCCYGSVEDSSVYKLSTRMYISNNY